VVVAGRRRAARAKLAVAAGGLLVFGAGVGLARASYAGHAKHRARPLAAPARFRSIVHDDLLRAGIVAPAQAPPQAETSAS
jgi:hypothetical protein